MNNKDGYIAIVVSLFVSGILLALVSSLSIESVSFFDQATRKEYREMNYHNAFSCINEALIYLSHDYFFNSSKEIYLDKYNCSILEAKRVGDFVYINTVGNYKKANVYREATIKISDTGLEIISIQ